VRSWSWWCENEGQRKGRHAVWSVQGSGSRFKSHVPLKFDEPQRHRETQTRKRTFFLEGLIQPCLGSNLPSLPSHPSHPFLFFPPFRPIHPPFPSFILHTLLLVLSVLDFPRKSVAGTDFANPFVPLWILLTTHQSTTKKSQKKDSSASNRRVENHPRTEHPFTLIPCQDHRSQIDHGTTVDSGL